MDDLKLNEACLDSQDQQGDSLRHPPAEHEQAGGSRRHVDKTAATNPEGQMDPPVHGVVIHECPVPLQVELAERENSQGNEGDGENQTQQGVRSAATLGDTDEGLREGNGH